MMFLFKKRPIVVDFFTDNAAVFEVAKPDYAHKFFPDWWKALPKQIRVATDPPFATMKTCAGFLDLYAHGFILPLWTDVEVEIRQDGGYDWYFSSAKFAAMAHDVRQADSFLIPNNLRNLKLTNPWIAETKSDVYWHCTTPFWSQSPQQDWVTPPGTLSLKMQNMMNVNLFITNINVPRRIFIPFRTPILHLLPTSERPVQLKHHLVSEQEWQQKFYRHTPLTFINSYLKRVAASKDEG